MTDITEPTGRMSDFTEAEARIVRTALRRLQARVGW